MNNQLCVHKTVLAGTSMDLKADLGLVATVLLTQELKMEAMEQTIASTSIKKLPNVYVLIQTPSLVC